MLASTAHQPLTQNMLQPLNILQKRIESIDILRGLVMIIMALDHVRDYFHIAANVDNPLNLATTTPELYFTRWITHFCAPVFVFLSGTSIYLQSLRKTKKALAAFLIKRGLWLILVEVVIIALAWTFNPSYNFIPLQVIWAIPSFWWDLLHSARFTSYFFAKDHAVIIAYPFLPWTGLMMLGFCAGKFFAPQFYPEQRKKILILSGIGLIVLFVIIRFTNDYGDPADWAAQKNSFYTFLSFLNINKYPPSLLYMCITIGPALLFLAMIEKTKNGFTNFLSIYGRVAFFYYILHIYLVHLLSAIGFFIRGHSLEEASKTGNVFPFYFLTPGEGYNLAVVYGVWLMVIIILYPLCKWYDQYKTNHKEKWWLSYL